MMATLLDGQLVVTYLSSYEGMGTARVHCVSGCTCSPVDLDGHRGNRQRQRHVSVWKSHVVDGVKLDPRVAVCVIGINVLNQTASGGFKFKLKGFKLGWALPQTAGGSMGGSDVGANLAPACSAASSKKDKTKQPMRD